MADDDLEQTNVRVPGSAKPLLSRLARMLREDRTFAHRLKRFIEEETNPERASLLSLRVERLEQQVDDLFAAVGERPLRDQTPKVAVPKVDRSTPPVAWTTGTGRGRRLTLEGEAELRRLASEGWSNGRIAERLGVRAYAVAQKRRPEG